MASGWVTACAWFAGTLEGKPDICIRLATLAPDAEAWSQSSQVSEDPARSEQNPVLFPDPQGEGVWLFHTAQPGGGRQEECEVMLRPLEIAPSGWRRSRPLARTAARQLRARARCGPGRRGMAAAAFPLQGVAGRPLDRQPRHRRRRGQRRPRRKLVTGRGAGVERLRAHDDRAARRGSHGRLLPAAAGGLRLPDRKRGRGRSWSAPEATDVPNNNSSIAAIRLADGRIALLCNPVSAAQFSERRASLYDELGEDDDRADPTGGVAAIWGVPRPALALRVRRRWPFLPDAPHRRRRPGACLSNEPLDGRNKELSYPALIQGPDGSLHLAYTYHRRAIKYVRLAPGWLDQA